MEIETPGKRIKYLREQMGLSQGELADQVGMTGGANAFASMSPTAKSTKLILSVYISDNSPIPAHKSQNYAPPLLR